MGVVWGIPYLLIKVAVSDLSPPTLVFLRTLIGAAVGFILILAGSALTARRPVPARAVAIAEP